MLTDQELVCLRADERYRQITRLGLEKLADDVVASGDDDLKASVSGLYKFATKLWRARIIRRELHEVTCVLIERFLNRELRWERIPQSVRIICQATEASYSWLRYDVPRVKALFKRSHGLLSEASMRELIKVHSSLPAESRNDRLIELRSELEHLEEQTIRSIRTRGIFDSLTDLNADEFYKSNETEIQQKFLQGATGGALGLPGPR